MFDIHWKWNIGWHGLWYRFPDRSCITDCPTVSLTLYPGFVTFPLLQWNLEQWSHFSTCTRHHIWTQATNVQSHFLHTILVTQISCLNKNCKCPQLTHRQQGGTMGWTRSVVTTLSLEYGGDNACHGKGGKVSGPGSLCRGLETLAWVRFTLLSSPRSYHGVGRLPGAYQVR